MATPNGSTIPMGSRAGGANPFALGASHRRGQCAPRSAVARLEGCELFVAQGAHAHFNGHADRFDKSRWSMRSATFPLSNCKLRCCMRGPLGCGNRGDREHLLRLGSWTRTGAVLSVAFCSFDPSDVPAHNAQRSPSAAYGSRPTCHARPQQTHSQMKARTSQPMLRSFAAWAVFSLRRLLFEHGVHVAARSGSGGKKPDWRYARHILDVKLAIPPIQC